MRLLPNVFHIFSNDNEEGASKKNLDMLLRAVSKKSLLLQKSTYLYQGNPQLLPFYVEQIHLECVATYFIKTIYKYVVFVAT